MKNSNNSAYHDLSNKRILITGVTVRPVNHVFKDITTGKPTHTEVFVDGIKYKASMGAATAFECAKAGAIVHLISSDETKLQIVKKWIIENIPNSQIEYSLCNLNNTIDLQKLADSIPLDIPLYWVQSLGLGAGTVALDDDNPYLPINELSDELIENELSVFKNTARLLKTFLPRFRKQRETRICIVSSMSAVRSNILASVHDAGKGAVSRFTNAATIELNQDNIFITDIRPGIVDAGTYDSEKVQDAMTKVGKSFGYDYTKTGIFCCPPSSVGKAIVMVLSSEAHILSINMVAKGQWPHEGS